MKIYMRNKGKKCSTVGCPWDARKKGFCHYCYNIDYRKKKQ